MIGIRLDGNTGWVFRDFLLSPLGSWSALFPAFSISLAHQDGLLAFYNEV
jgi:hypothetical protein